ncbi:NUMOD3 domain-containing DNA-binding protein [Paenibacillus sp. FSL L8-0708]|uniref:NUMOD3 domain-containing DNA-binding protein n=1 Tax=Paenibacillus sp. FSL L8-0708 TaxID=2975311 RepID=UPI0030FA164F
MAVDKHTVGIYTITNTVSGKTYVGQSSRVGTRWKVHVRLLNAGKHENPALQRAWTKYGSAAFDFALIEECSVESLDEREIYYVKKFDSYTKGYNCDLGGSQGRGYVVSLESRQKMSAAKKGRPSTMKGKKHSEEAKANMREGHKNRPPVSDETRMKLSEAAKGKVPTEEARRKSGDARRGKPRPIEQMRAAWEATRGKPLSLERKEKIRKVTNATALEIYYKATSGEGTSDLAKEYGLHVQTIRDIKGLRRRFAELEVGGADNDTDVSCSA